MGVATDRDFSALQPQDAASVPTEPTDKAVVGWQPIATAPRDATEVITLSGRKVIRLGWYFKPSSRTEGWRDESSRPIKPTHWMPLPATPGEA